jgi:hypothetical protein
LAEIGINLNAMGTKPGTVYVRKKGVGKTFSTPDFSNECRHSIATTLLD